MHWKDQWILTDMILEHNITLNFAIIYIYIYIYNYIYIICMCLEL